MNPKMRLPDGTVLNSNLKITPILDNKSKYQNNGTHKVMIIKSVPIDDENNRFKQGVEYAGVIIGGPRDGEILTNIQATDGFGGEGNFHETVLTPKTKVIKGKNKGDKTPPENTDGSYAMVTFLGGHFNHPVILGGLPQPNNAEYGAKKEDGTLLRGKFQGLSYSINKDGVLTLQREGTTIIIDSANQVNIVSDKNVKIDSASKIELGAGATQSFVLGDIFQTLFNGHTHSGGAVPDQQMSGSHKSSLIKGK